MTHDATSTASSALEPLRRRLYLCVALLTLLSYVTGGLASFALAKSTELYDGHMMLSAHVAGLLGACLLFAMTFTLPMLRFTLVTTSRLGWLFAVSIFANWGISTAKAFFFVHGIAPGGSPANTVVYGLLNVLVVVPGLVASFFWVVGLARGRAGHHPS